MAHPEHKKKFEESLRNFVKSLAKHSVTDDGSWAVKGFIDAYSNIFTISSDTKVLSKILEIHLFPELLKFASDIGYRIVLADHQNYYPDMSFVAEDNDAVRFAVDFKTTYRLLHKPGFCNGFTLGSHGDYFIRRDRSKNIQFPYSTYLGHFCLCAIYSRTSDSNIDDTKIYQLSELRSIVSVVKDFEFFVQEKWKIASDRRGSYNTANIGSIDHIPDLIAGNGMFSFLGEQVFDEYWINFGKISILDATGKSTHIKSLEAYLKHKGLDYSGIVQRAKSPRRKRAKPE